MRAQMCSKVCSKVRAHALMGKASRSSRASSHAAQVAAGSRLLETYAGLAQRGAHLFGELLGGQTPKQWNHYPDDDAIDQGTGFQWFYHSHSPEDRPGAFEHGHIHLFARRKLWSRRLHSVREIEFGKLGSGASNPNTRHLLAIGLDAKGVPVSLFTVNSWVTGDLMLTAKTTADLLDRIRLDTGHPDVDAVVESLVRLCRVEIRTLLAQRDSALWAWPTPAVLTNERLDVLSELPICIDAKLAGLI